MTSANTASRSISAPSIKECKHQPGKFWEEGCCTDALNQQQPQHSDAMVQNPVQELPLSPKATP
jgi:hypothetical protein